MRNTLLKILLLICCSYTYTYASEQGVADSSQEPGSTVMRRDVVTSGIEESKSSFQFLWIDAEDFWDYGTWVLDTQYVHLMGSAYLIAAGIGQPVQNAVTEIKVPQSGRYQVWVRDRNWLSEHAPGRFQIQINGRALDKVLGAGPSDEWVWEKAGSVDLTAGTASMALHDLTGYYARCDAVLLTTDSGYRPPASMEAVQQERARLTDLSIEPLSPTVAFTRRTSRTSCLRDAISA